MQTESYEVQYGGPVQGGPVGAGVGPGVLPETGGINMLWLIALLALVAVVLHVQMVLRARRES